MRQLALFKERVESLEAGTRMWWLVSKHIPNVVELHVDDRLSEKLLDYLPRQAVRQFSAHIIFCKLGELCVLRAARAQEQTSKKAATTFHGGFVALMPCAKRAGYLSNDK